MTSTDQNKSAQDGTKAEQSQTKRDRGRVQPAIVLCVLAGLIGLIALAALMSGPLTTRQTIGAVLILVIAVATALFALWSQQGPAVDAMGDRSKASVAWVLALGGGALVVFVIVKIFLKYNAGTATGLPLVLLASVVVLLIVISLMAFVFSVLGLSSKKEALGLPDGSVRAIVALMLLLVFTVAAVFIFTTVVNSPIDPATGRSRLPADAIEIGKQLITLLGTLVTAVASFYFGANAVSSAHKDAKEQAQPPESGPILKSISPNPLPSGGQPSLTISGSNLSKISSVTLQQGGTAIAGTILSGRTDSTLVVSLVIPPGKSGNWDVMVNGVTQPFAHVEVK